VRTSDTALTAVDGGGVSTQVGGPPELDVEPPELDVDPELEELETPELEVEPLLDVLPELDVDPELEELEMPELEVEPELEVDPPLDVLPEPEPELEPPSGTPATVPPHDAARHAAADAVHARASARPIRSLLGMGSSSKWFPD
jgi:hypothetical protein